MQRTRKLWIATHFLVAPLACSEAELADDSPPAATEDRLYVLTDTLWPQREIPVCWEGPGWAVEKLAVREGMTGPGSWSAHARIDFTGWDECDDDSKGIRITPATDSLSYGGWDEDGTTEMRLGFMDDPLHRTGGVPNCIYNGATREECFQWLGLHEFGHAIGFAHEQNRPDTPESCTRAPQGRDGDTVYGEWDLDSVMNYCGQELELSPTDIDGVRAFYGLRAAGTRVAALPRARALDLFVSGAEGSVYKATHDPAGTHWRGWNRVVRSVPGGLLAGSPVAVVPQGADGSSTRLVVAGNDDFVYTTSYTDGGFFWDDWNEVAGVVPGGLLPGAPITALTRKPDRSVVDLWVTNESGLVFSSSTVDGGASWTSWAQVGDAVPRRVPSGAQVAAVSRYPDGGALDVWVTGNDGRVYTAFRHDNGVPWNGWHALQEVPHGLPGGAPVTALPRYPNGTALDLWVTGSDGNVYTAYFNDAAPQWSAWHRVAAGVPSGAVPGAPVAAIARFPDGRGLDVWVTGNDGNVYSAYYHDALDRWEGWHLVAGPVPSGLPAGAAITALSRTPDGSGLEIFVRANDGNVYTAFYSDHGVPWNGWHLVAAAAPDRYGIDVSAVTPWAGSSIVADWTAPAGHATSDWVGLYRPGDPNDAMLDFRYIGTPAPQGGSYLQTPAEPGTFELRYFLDNSYTVAATSPPFTTVPIDGFSLEIGPSQVPWIGSRMTVSWQAPLGHASYDWVGLYPSGSSQPNAIDYAYLGTTGTSGALSLQLPLEIGTYEFRYFVSNSDTEAAVTVPFATVPIEGFALGPVAPANPRRNSTIIVDWLAPVQHGADWIGLYRVGADDRTYIDYEYIGLGSTSGTVDLTVPNAAGDYEVRYFFSNTFTRAASSPAFRAE